MLALYREFLNFGSGYKAEKRKHSVVGLYDLENDRYQDELGDDQEDDRNDHHCTIRYNDIRNKTIVEIIEILSNLRRSFSKNKETILTNIIDILCICIHISNIRGSVSTKILFKVIMKSNISARRGYTTKFSAVTLLREEAWVMYAKIASVNSVCSTIILPVCVFELIAYRGSAGTELFLEFIWIYCRMTVKTFD